MKMNCGVVNIGCLNCYTVHTKGPSICDVHGMLAEFDPCVHICPHQPLVFASPLWTCTKQLKTLENASLLKICDQHNDKSNCHY